MVISKKDIHSKKKKFDTLSFEMCHDSRCSVHRIPTHTNGSKAIIIIDVAFHQAITMVIRGIIRYVVCGQVQIASNLINMSACSLKCKCE